MSIWERQEYETRRQYEFFQQFLESNTRKFSEFHKEYTEKYQNNTELPKPPTYNTLQKWCTNNKWSERYKAYDKQVLDDATDTIRKHAAENIVQDYVEYDELERLVRQKSLETAKSVIVFDSKSAYTLSETSKALKTYQENKRLISGESTENTNSTINADIKSTFESKDKKIDDILKNIQEAKEPNEEE